MTDQLATVSAKRQEAGWSLYWRVLNYLRAYRGQFVMALLCMVVFGASDGVIPFLVKEILDGVFGSGRRDLLYLLPALIVVFAIIRALGDFGQQFLMARVGHRIVRDVRRDLQRHLLEQSPGYFVRQSGADLVARLTGDVLMVRSLLTESVAAVIRDVIRLVTLVIAALYLDATLACIAVIALPIGILPVYRFGRRMRRLSRAGQNATGALSSRLQEMISGIKIISIFGRSGYERDRFAAENEALTATLIRAERFRALTGPVNEVLASLAIAGVILYGGMSVLNGERTQGDFISFLLAVFLMYDPFKKLSRIHGVVQQGLAGAERVFEVLDTPTTIASPPQPLSMASHNRIEFAGVSFRYPGVSDWVLRDINLTIEEGSCVAVVGFSGAGKSTLVDLIPRFIDPVEGVVRVGGVSVKDVSLQELRARIALVGQHTVLFNDTVYANIAYGRAGASAEEVALAAKAAFADGFISELPAGYDTIVGEGGFALSGGQRQRLAIARAILNNAPILILDEATASLDNQSEREVQSALELLMRGRTTVVIAHRLSTVRHADRIVVMQSGSIVEEGSHTELMARAGEYARLYELAFAEKPDGTAAVQ